MFAIRISNLNSVIVAGAALLALGAFIAPPACAQSKTPLPQRVQGRMNVRMRASLRGLKGFNVVVAPLPPDIESAGLTRAAIQTAVETTLKKAGVPLYQKPGAVDWRDHPDVVQFIVSVQVSQQGSDYIAVVVGEVYQEVTIARGAAANGFDSTGRVGNYGVGIDRITLPTWRKITVGVLSRDKLPRAVQRAQEAAQALVVDYDSANQIIPKVPR